MSDNLSYVTIEGMEASRKEAASRKRLFYWTIVGTVVFGVLMVLHNYYLVPSEAINDGLAILVRFAVACVLLPTLFGWAVLLIPKAWYSGPFDESIP